LTATIIGTEAADTVILGFTSILGQPRATVGADSIIGLGGNDLLHGLEGGDTIAGGPGQDTMDGGPDDDRFILRGEILGEADSIDGGTGRDTLDLTQWTTFPVIRLDLTAGTLLGGAGGLLFLFASIVQNSVENVAGSGFDEWLLGTAASNLLNGGDGADTLIGEAQADTLDGGGGADVLVGGAGYDIYIVDDPHDQVADFDGQGEVHARASHTLTGGITVLLLDSDGGLAGTGTVGADTIQGGGGGDTLRGADGNDTLDGDDGGDLLIGGEGADRLFAYDWRLLNSALLVGGDWAAFVFTAARGADTLEGGLGNDVYEIGAEDVILPDSGGLDTVSAIGSFTLPGGIEALSLIGFADIRLDGTGNGLANRLVGHDAANRLAGGGGADSLDGNRGNDTLLGGAGADILLGDEGEDTLQGGADADTLDGASGNDVLLGGAGDDRLSGMSGLDRLRGDAGADRFVIGGAAFVATDADRILDFDAAAGDRIAIEGSRLPGATPPAGPLDPALFAANLSGRLAIAGPSFVHETDAGRLWYDDDWSGGTDRVLVAILVGKPALTAAEIALF
jgi:Ca2+-binding RTX toxin-like protein